MSAVKFRVVCDWCGEKQPRATTAYTVEQWMHRHAYRKHNPVSVACSTCGAKAGEPCTTGQHRSPSPHASTAKASVPHAARSYALGATS